MSRRAGGVKEGAKEGAKVEEVSFSLFESEDQLILEAEVAVGKLEDVAGGVRKLSAAYRQSAREQKRLVRLSDRMQLELQNANRRLEEQARQLQELNRALNVEIEHREKLTEELRQLAVTDSLTGVASRQHLLDLGVREVRRHRRSHLPMCVLMADLDHFKALNDRYGHAAGDAALRHFSTVCRRHLRETDLIGRMGGEEFAFILPETSLPSGVEIAQRLCSDLAARPVEAGDLRIELTVSIGVTFFLSQSDDEHADLERAIAEADRALYESKHLGRNRVTARSP